MVKNLCKENYQAAANAALQFPPFRRELVKAVAQQVKKEIRDYSKGKSMAKYEGDPLKLKNFNGEEFLEEASERMPITHSIVTTTSKDGVKFLVNKQVLALSAILNTWLPRSNFIYRMNTLLTTGCCKTEVMDLFHRLGLSSHPNTIRAQLQSSANHFNEEILVWKSQIETNRKQLNLLEEVVTTQTGNSGERDSMNLCSIDFSRETAQKCKHFDEDTYQLCKDRLPGVDVLEDTDLLNAAENLKKEKLPLYRLVTCYYRILIPSPPPRFLCLFFPLKLVVFSGKAPVWLVSFFYCWY